LLELILRAKQFASVGIINSGDTECKEMKIFPNAKPAMGPLAV
jgi:hypothetical protein